MPDGYVGPSFGEGRGTSEIFTQDNKSPSIFAQADFAETETSTAMVGVSYCKDEKAVNMEHQNSALFSQVDLVQVGYLGALQG